MKSRFINIDSKNIGLFFKSFEKEYANCDEIAEVNISVKEFKNKINVLYTWLLVSKALTILTGILLISSMYFNVLLLFVPIFVLFVFLLTNCFNELSIKKENKLEIDIRHKGIKILEIPFNFVLFSRILDALILVLIILSIYINPILLTIAIGIFFVKFVILTFNFKAKLDSYYRNLMLVESFIENGYEFSS